MRRFADYHPAAVAFALLSAAGIAMFRLDPILIAIALAGSLLTCLAVGTFGNWRLHGAMLLFFLAASLINPLVSHHGVTVLVVLNHNPVTLEALWYGVAAAGMIAATFHFFRAFSAVMTTDKLLCLFGGFSPKIALLLAMTLRYVPLFRRQWGEVQRAQTALGLYREDDLWTRGQGGLRIFSVMTTWALENGVVTADSMAARGYGVGKRSRFTLFAWRKGDVLLMLSALFLTALTLWGLAEHSFDFYPMIRMAQLTPRAVTGFTAYGLLTMLPALIQAKEAARWHFLTCRL